MPSKLMSIKEAVEYAKKNKLKGLKLIGRNKIEYINSVGNKKRVIFTKNTLIYYRGNGKWAIYNPELDSKIIGKRIDVYNIKNPKKWAQYGDLNPPPKKKVMKKEYKKAKIGRGKGYRKKLLKELPEPAGNEKSL